MIDDLGEAQNSPVVLVVTRTGDVERRISEVAAGERAVELRAVEHEGLAGPGGRGRRVEAEREAIAAWREEPQAEAQPLVAGEGGSSPCCVRGGERGGGEGRL